MNEFEDWLAERKLTVARSDYALTEFDLVDAPLTGWDGEPVHRIRLTRDAAVWLRDALTSKLAALEGVE